MNLKIKLIKSIDRSEFAYKLYSETKMFYQAQRIYKANKLIYSQLQKYFHKCENHNNESILNYIFHLEDWFTQFELLEKINQPNLEDIFIFERLKKSIPYPVTFKEFLKSDCL